MKAKVNPHKEDKMSGPEKDFLANYESLCIKHFSLKPIHIVYEPFTIKVANNLSYTPDFLVVFEDGSFVIIEVKQSKYARGYTYTMARARAAKNHLKYFEFVEMRKEKEGWIKRVL